MATERTPMRPMTITDDLESYFFNLARLALAGKSTDVELLVRRARRKLQATSPGLADRLSQLLASSPTRLSPLRTNVP